VLDIYKDGNALSDEQFMILKSLPLNASLHLSSLGKSNIHSENQASDYSVDILTKVIDELRENIRE
jgi:hypothetical protein